MSIRSRLIEGFRPSTPFSIFSPSVLSVIERGVEITYRCGPVSPCSSVGFRFVRLEALLSGVGTFWIVILLLVLCLIVVKCPSLTLVTVLF